MPPIIGAAIRCMTSEPAPLPMNSGIRPARVRDSLQAYFDLAMNGVDVRRSGLGQSRGPGTNVKELRADCCGEATKRQPLPRRWFRFVF